MNLAIRPMDYRGTRTLNNYYVTSTACRIKVLELVFGAGAWGPVVMTDAYISGYFSYYLWATISSWVLIFGTFLLGLFGITTVPTTPDEWRRYDSPKLQDLILDAIIVVIYVPAIIVYAVEFYINSPLRPFFNTSGIFILLMAVLALLVHVANAGNLVTYLLVAKSARNMGSTWWWNKILSLLCPQKKSNIAVEQQRVRRDEVCTNVATVTKTTQGAQEIRSNTYMTPLASTGIQEQSNEIYQDLN